MATTALMPPDVLATYVREAGLRRCSPPSCAGKFGGLGSLASLRSIQDMEKGRGRSLVCPETLYAYKKVKKYAFGNVIPRGLDAPEIWSGRAPSRYVCKCNRDATSGHMHEKRGSREGCQNM